MSEYSTVNRKTHGKIYGKSTEKPSVGSPTAQSQGPQGRLLQGRLHGQLPSGPGAAQKDLHRSAAAAGDAGGYGVVP